MKLNFPNSLVIFRIILAVAIVIVLLVGFNLGTNDLYSNENIQTNYYFISVGVMFIIASITDWLDGYWARKYNQVTNFGKLFDPLADKILVNSVLIIFSMYGVIPIIVTIIFIVRDILVDGLRGMLATKNIVLAADKFGKLKTIFQMIGLILLFFIAPTINSEIWISIIILLPIYIALFFSVLSGINYYIKGFNQLK